MENTGLSSGDLALLNSGRNSTDSGMWFVLLLFMMATAGGNWFGGGRANVSQPAPAPVPGNYVTQQDLTDGLNNSSIQQQLQQISLSSANNNYETAQLIYGQTNQMMNQNNSNFIAAIEGFNNINQNIMGQTATLGSKLDQLGYHMDQCCCSIKTQMLQDRLDDANRQIATLTGQISNANQSQYLLGQMGRFVAWEPSGTATVAS